MIREKNLFLDNLLKQGVLKTPAIIEAFKKIDRADFIPPELKERAYINEPLPIGEGQTISQPLTVAFMLELLQPEPGNKIFEIGFGSGWQTALLAYIVSEKGGKSQVPSSKLQTRGMIYAVERIPELFRFGRKNVAKYGFIKNGIVKMIGGDATLGLKRHAPFDRIIAAASGKEVPEEWLKELKIGGRLVAPVKESIWLYVKTGKNEFSKKEYPGFIFVPLVSAKS